MSRFKVGDRVVGIENEGSYYEYGEVYLIKGEKGIVKEVFDYFVTVEFDNNVGGWGNKELNIKKGRGLHVDNDKLNLLKEEEQKKDLKSLLTEGVIVAIEEEGFNHTVYCAICNKLLMNCFYAIEINKFDEELYYKDNRKVHIDKIYSPNKKASYFEDLINTENSKLLWERK